MDAEISHLSLLDAFRHNYFRIEGVIQEAMRNPADTAVLERIRSDLEEYMGLVEEVNDPVFGH